MYQIGQETKLFEWLARERDPDDRQVMLDWFAEFVLDPLRSAHRIPGQRAPIYLVVTAVPRVTLTFLLAEQFKTIQLIEVGTLD